MLCIPKNLVYIFILMICFSFGAMSYIAYSGTNLKEFVKSGKAERSQFEIHELFKVL